MKSLSKTNDFSEKVSKTLYCPKKIKKINPSSTDSWGALVNQPTRVSEIWVFWVFWDSTRFWRLFHRNDWFYCGFRWFLTKINEILKWNKRFQWRSSKNVALSKKTKKTKVPRTLEGYWSASPQESLRFCFFGTVQGFGSFVIEMICFVVVSDDS